MQDRRSIGQMPVLSRHLGLSAVERCEEKNGKRKYEYEYAKSRMAKAIRYACGDYQKLLRVTLWLKFLYLTGMVL